MKGDVHYKWITSGSCATSGSTVHNFFGTYAGLSQLNADEVVHLQIGATGNAMRIGLEAQLTNNTGYRITPTASVVDLPPIKASDASAMQFVNDISGSNTSAVFVIWRRGII
jgi:hypothetical protein